jgi:phenylacetate-CoA ligase
VIVPIPGKGDNRALNERCKELEQMIAGWKVRVKADFGENTPGKKYNHWEMKGVPLRIDLGSKDIEAKKLTIHSPKIIISSAETLNHPMRQKIETIFGTALYDFYGSRETSPIAGECTHHTMHMFQYNNYMEILNENNEQVQPDQEGRVVITNLHNYSMPFIRYDIGDRAILGSTHCDCHNMLPTIKQILGRIEENFIKEDGTIVIGYFFVHVIGVVQNKGLIKKFQVIQEDYNKITIMYVPVSTLDDSEKKNIDEKIRVVMGKGCQIIWVSAEEIPKTKSGKYLSTISKIPREQK